MTDERRQHKAVFCEAEHTDALDAALTRLRQEHPEWQLDWELDWDDDDEPAHAQRVPLLG